jgi:hypothetical protein
MKIQILKRLSLKNNSLRLVKVFPSKFPYAFLIDLVYSWHKLNLPVLVYLLLVYFLINIAFYNIIELFRLLWTFN